MSAPDAAAIRAWLTARIGEAEDIPSGPASQGLRRWPTGVSGSVRAVCRPGRSVTRVWSSSVTVSRVLPPPPPPPPRP